MEYLSFLILRIRSVSNVLLALNIGVDKFWVPEIKEKSDENCGQILIGNKLDMINEKTVPSEQAKLLADTLEIPYFETSAKTGENVE